MRKRQRNRLLVIGPCVLLLAVMAGCAPAHFNAAPQLQDKVRSIKTVAIMPPNIKVYQVSVGGSAQLMDDLTAAATQHVAKAIEKKLKGQSSFVFTLFPSPSALPDTGSSPEVAALKDELEDTQALFEAVNGSIIPHASKNIYVPGQRFREKLKNFDYSLGPDVQRLAKLASADALLFIAGVDNFSTGGLRTLNAAVITFGAVGWGITWLSAALVDGATGAILWYDVVGFLLRSSLIDSHSAADLVEEVLADFPVSERPLRRD